MNSAQHSSKSQEHYSPVDVVEAAHRTMVGIDLDPASCATANTIVKAANYYNQQQDGLSRIWHGNVFLNPPGGKVGKRSSAGVWWDKLVEEYFITTGHVEQAIFVGFSLEFLQTSQNYALANPLCFPFCIPSKRLMFLDENLRPQRSPTHANVIVYLPPRVGTAEAIGRFQDAFQDIGHVVVPVRAA